ncbi:MAG: UDP-N-acetylglucosamine--N-acetylmuramyl-(pentapeptide) pyrophosphoryl-undecaprenol N-acetylglucosamine transferase [Bacilli bacterium]
MKIVVTGGGTGGHIYPALAIINRLKVEFNDLDITYIGTHDRMESKMIPELGIKYIGLNMQGVNRKNMLKNFKLLGLLVKNYLFLKKIYKKERIDIVIGTGGYITVPVIYAAKKSNISTLIFDADKDFGMATKKLMKYADIVCSGYKYPSLKYSNVIYSGNPRAQEVYSTVDRSNIKNKALFIFGSLGSETINDFFSTYFSNTNIDYDVVYVTGKGLYNNFVGKLNNDRVKVLEYIDDISKEIDDVKFVVSRSGATFVSELQSLAIPSIFVPSPYVANNEQVENIKHLVENELAFMIKEQELSSNNFENAVNNIRNNYNLIVSKLKQNRDIDGLEIILDKIKGLINE